MNSCGINVVIAISLLLSSLHQKRVPPCHPFSLLDTYKMNEIKMPWIFLETTLLIIIILLRRQEHSSSSWKNWGTMTGKIIKRKIIRQRMREREEIVSTTSQVIDFRSFSNLKKNCSKMFLDSIFRVRTHTILFLFFLLLTLNHHHTI